MAIAVILLLAGIFFRSRSSSGISAEDAEQQIEDNLKAVGVKEYVHDVIHLIDLCEKLDSVDTNKINMLGVSRGGMMTYETLRDDRRIHKAVVVAGVADCAMNYEERNDMKSLLKELIGGTPEQLPEEYRKRSAVDWADEINTPLLIFHTTGDDKVSVKQADKLVKQLKKYQKDYEYVTFSSDIHGDLLKSDVEKIREWLQM